MKLTKALIVAVSGLLLLVVGLAFLKVNQFATMKAAKPETAATIVTAEEAKNVLWEPSLSAVGSLAPYRGVTVTTESSGIVSKILFEPGSIVKAGDLLFELDSSVLTAQLNAAEAKAELARLTAVRTRDLFKSNSTAKADLDNAEALLKQTLAELASIQAQIAQKQVRAPFAGRLGIRQINLGQYIEKGSSIVSLQSLDPIYVNFTMPQQQFAQLGVGMKVRISLDAMPERVFEGAISAINPDIDAATRSVKVQATLANADEALRPGMFVNVSVILPKKEEMLLIPITAVLYAPYGDSVFVIEKSEKGLVLRQQFVRLGKARGDFIAVVSGLKPGTKIVSTGVFKLRNNMPVEIDNKLAPALSESPKPVNS